MKNNIHLQNKRKPCPKYLLTLMGSSSSPVGDMIVYVGCHTKAVIARNNSFALTASSLWNSLPQHIRDISGLSVDAFKRRLDKVLKCYPDEPRCSATGLYTDIHGRASNSLYDISRNREVKERVATKPEDVQEGGLPRWPGSN